MTQTIPETALSISLDLAKVLLGAFMITVDDGCDEIDEDSGMLPKKKLKVKSSTRRKWKAKTKQKTGGRHDRVE